MAKIERTILRNAIDQDCDADTLIVCLDNGAQLNVYAYADRNGVTTVSVDPSGYAGRVRILVDDVEAFDGQVTE